MKILLRLKAWQLFVLTLVPMMFVGLNILFQIIYLLGAAIYVGWIFSVGSTMHSFIDSESRPRIIYFKISCLLMFSIIVVGFYTPFESIGNTYFYFVFGIIGIVVMLYSFMFAARMLESAIEGKIVNRSESLKTFFYIWVFPIGVWYLQPAVKRVLMQHETNS